MKTFQIHFDNRGNVLVNNITGVTLGTTECVNVTQPYVDKFGGIVDMVMLTTEEQIQNNEREKEIS